MRNRSVRNIQIKAHEIKRQKIYKSVRYMEYPKRSNTHGIRVPEVEERDKGTEAIFKEILTEFSNTG